ncbi:RCH1 Solute carrier RCH1 [Candida maltosa Xu316]|uniref:Transporter protein, putative (Azole resistance protein, putative) n=1 Tax=Candida maltosa (strain Xu316) TaxID=1245528 RepID=M3JX40_CANMX|nr:Transporter protein, putative (Azole resistance protein, putative) [Candida maltosa Xu316]
MSLETFKETKFYIWSSKVISFLISQWFFVLLGVFIALAHSYPQFAKQGGIIRAEYTISYGAVAIIFLISGLSMSTKQLLVNAANWRAHFTVLSMSFLITSSIIFGIASGIKASHDGQIDDWMLVGLIVTHACPTTVSSNVVMTKLADGNDILTLCEVFIGNILGAFITPALLQLYMRGTWDFGNPSHQEGGESTIQELYGETMKQLGLSVFIPLFVGQVVQNVLPDQTKWCLSYFKLGKVGSFMLLLIMFQSFSTAFAQNAFESVSHASIIFLVFFNIGIYLFFTVLTYIYSRPFWVKRWFFEEPNETSSTLYRYSYKFCRPFYYNRKDTVAVMLCGPAKTAALGVSLVSSQYGAHNPKLGIILVPLVLYQAEQVITANFLVKLMKKWIHAEDMITIDEEPTAASINSINK